MVQQFMSQRPWCILITRDADQQPVTGMFNPLVETEHTWLHLHRQDPQLRHMIQEGSATLVFADYHGFVPSYAKDPENGSFATMFYRYVEVRVRAEALEDRQQSSQVLERMMQVYQPEGGYRPLDDLDFYAASFNQIKVVRLTPVSQSSKWKLGQNRRPEEQLIAHSYLRRESLRPSASSPYLPNLSKDLKPEHPSA